MVAFSAFLILLIGIVTYKRIVNKQDVGTYYTPFDKITSQTNVEFHQEKQEKKNKRTKKGTIRIKTKNPIVKIFFANTSD